MAVLVIIAAHVVLCLSFLFFPAQGRLQNGMVAVYKQLVLLGPFFTESRIKTTRWLSIRYMKGNTWSSYRNLTEEHLKSYRANPLRWDKLSYVAYERHLGQTLESVAHNKPFEIVKSSAAFRELNGFLLQEFIAMPVDSIQIICQEMTYLPREQTSILDTTFVFNYNPVTIGETAK
ncbi:MAG TPA: hypothetical protein VFZ52_15140 [Chryseolinea sp.]